MTLTSLKNEQLLDILFKKSADERKLTLEIIELLGEVERRSLHLEKGYGSLLEFCVNELKYSESAAYRRISAMRITKELPQVKQSIQNGALNLVTVTQAQTFFRQENKYQSKVYSPTEKLLVLQSLENKSKRQAEKILLEKSPELPKPEAVRQITDKLTRVTLCLDENVLRQLDQLKSKYSHINPNPSYAELIGLMAAELLKKKNCMQETKSTKNEIHEKSKSVAQSAEVWQRRIAKPPVKNSRIISATIRKFIFNRDQSCCSYIHPVTKKKCGSRFQLQVDHVQAFSQGGSHDVQNLRLVCRHHNLFYWRFVQSRLIQKSSG